MEFPSRLLALILFVILLPLLGALAVLVRLTSAGPAFYRQQRVGKNGRLFWIYKFRSMRLDAEASSGPVWSQTLDPRVTPLGKILRYLHLDEFPQLWNVLRGEMALVGPRPERPEFVQNLVRHVPGYLERLAVKPGITGLAQVNLPPDTDYDSVKRKLILDLEYIRRAGMLLDLRIILCTFFRLFFIHGGITRRLLQINHYPELESEPPKNPLDSGEGDRSVPSLVSRLLISDDVPCPSPE